MRHEAWLACSCLSRDQVSRVRGYCVGESRPSSGIRMALVAFCGLLCGMDTSSEVADQGSHHSLDNSTLAVWDELPRVMKLSALRPLLI